MTSTKTTKVAKKYDNCKISKKIESFIKRLEEISENCKFHEIYETLDNYNRSKRQTILTKIRG